jgi:hypothetical protein
MAAQFEGGGAKHDGSKNRGDISFSSENNHDLCPLVIPSNFVPRVEKNQ